MTPTNPKSENFVDKNLPPRDQWPKFINMAATDEQASFNSAEQLLDDAVKEGFGNKIALYSNTETWTYELLLEKANQIAHVLKEDMGLVVGDRVLLRCTNSPMLAACWLAVIKAGGIAVTTIAMLRAKEIQVIAEQSAATIALCDNSLSEEMEISVEATECLSKVIYFTGAGNLCNRMREKPVTFDNYPSIASDIAMIAFTSGTTGKPKAALHSHQAIIAVCETFSKQVVRPNSDDIFSGTPPLGFVYGLGGLLLFPLYARASTVLLNDVRTNSLINAIEKFKVTILYTAPTGYKAILENFDLLQLGSLRKCISAGEALPDYISQDWLDKTGIRLIDGIGSTELLHIFLSVQHPGDPVGSLGKAVPGYEVCVINKDGTPCPKNKIGYLAVRGPTGCRYLNDSRQSAYVVNGWNMTGDTVKIDDQGFFWYQARTDGMIISSGYNIAAPEVEQTLSQHPAVAECAVIGVPDPKRGHIVRAYIVLNDKFRPDNQLIKDIQKFAKKEGAPYKYPRSIKFIDRLPRTPTGKIQHFELRAKPYNKDFS